MRQGFRAGALALALWGSAVFAAEPERPALAVLDFEAKGPSTLEAEAVTAGAVRGIRELDVFNVLAAADVRELLAIERTKLLMGGEDSGAQLPLAEALGARHSVVG